jgi:hypothetical protein
MYELFREDRRKTIEQLQNKKVGVVEVGGNSMRR